jgi:hypothetical protein
LVLHFLIFFAVSVDLVYTVFQLVYCGTFAKPMTMASACRHLLEVDTATSINMKYDSIVVVSGLP